MSARSLLALGLSLLLVGCGASSPDPTPPPESPQTGVDTGTGTDDSQTAATPPFAVEEVTTFDEPWAMTFLPSGEALVTERGGALTLVEVTSGEKRRVEGTPTVLHEGQGGLGDIVLGPTYTTDGTVYLSWVEATGDGRAGALVGRARLHTEGTPRLEDLRPIWRQEPTTGRGHYSHRLAVSPDDDHLFVSSGDRQKMDPAQDTANDLGSILRLDLDGRPADGNPFGDRGGQAAEIWSYGHRNVLGLAFDADGRLWASEMGPKGGDELNLVQRGGNYGWPRASNGSHYDGKDIPDHTAGDSFVTPKVWWTPSVSPGSLLLYTGTAFPEWTGDAFLGALSGQALIRVDLDGTSAAKADQWDMGERIREVEQGLDGTLWLLTDGPRGRLLHLTPR
ncbi:PQQ-dependent sugar dehydrogenase [Mobilicoccus sp.]|uniref:PQQ-dependent sugar dehydrogenase n=1 Tax=Mobilicoccus sp. TaxID=2034349 RepID=UPI0028AC8D49|nr:PQQ-dependent sugar dehydrogenase [Mobilicoccus sp.]